MVEFLSMTEGWMATSSGGKDTTPPKSEDEVPVDRDHEWWFGNEFIMTIYTPNLFELRRHLGAESKGKMKVVVTVGEASEDAPYAMTTGVQGEILGVEVIRWPGGHSLFAVKPGLLCRGFWGRWRGLEVHKIS
jgi:hypothetical protein